ncbi:hypothetical protein Tco_0205295 [Tanacetum coccineum]
METSKPLMKDENAEDVDVHLCRSMIGSLMYLTSLRPNIMFVVCACARFQVTPKVSHLHAVKRIFRKSTTGGCQFLRRRLISWQCKKQTIVANSTTEVEDSYEKRLIQVIKIHTDHNVADLLTKAFDVSRFQYLIARCLEWNGTSTKDEFQVSAVRVTYYWQVYLMLLLAFNTVVKIKNIKPIKQKWVKVLVYAARHSLIAVRHKFWATAKAKTIHEEHQIQALVDKKKVIIIEKSVKSDLMLEDAEGTECLPNDVIFEQLTLMGAKTTAWNEFSSTMASAIICLAINQKFNFSKYIFDNMMKNLEGGVKFLMYLRFVQVFLDKQVEGMSKHEGIYVTPSDTKKIFANMKREGKEPIPDEATNEEPISTPFCDPPQSAKSAQAKEIASLNKRVKHLEQRRKSRTSGLKRLRKGRKIANLDADVEVTLIDETQERYDEEMLFDVQYDLQGKEVVAEKEVAEKEVSVADPVTTAGEVVTSAIATTIVDELTLAQTLIEIKAAKPKAVITNVITITTVIASIRPKAKGIVFHDQEEQASAFTPIVSSSQLPQAKDKGKGKFGKDRVAQEEASREAVIEELDSIQAMIEADEQLATRLQAEEQEQFSIEEESRMLVEMIAERKKFFAAQRAAKQRSKPPIKTQIRNRMCAYLKNMGGYKHNQLKERSYEEI